MPDRFDGEHMEGIDTALILAIAGSLVVWSLVAARLQSFAISAPMAMVAFGLLLTQGPFSVVDVNVRSETMRSLAEVTLALLLFSDAARVNVRVLRRDAGIPIRLLVIGLPLTIALGTVIAIVLFGELDPWVAAAIGAVVAPTDAALGAQVIEDPHVPSRIRRVLNVESGLNDGIATPFVSFLIAGAVAESVSRPSVSLGGALGDLGVGVLVGVAIGLGGGLLVMVCSRRGWASPAYRGIAALALAVGAYFAALELGGNGFIAAFVGGLSIGSVLPEREQRATLDLDSQVGEVLSMVVWFLFGAAMLPALSGTTWQTIAFAVLALTVVRMVPVALVLVGSGLTARTVAFIGWFGPRGLASVVFGLIAFDALEGTVAQSVLNTVTITVLLSVIAHGMTAGPLSKRYGDRLGSKGLPEHEPMPVGTVRPRTEHG